jgi:hypothetical protein
VVHDRARLEVGEDTADLGRSVVLVDVEGDGARPVGAEHRLDVLGAVVEDEGHGVLALLPPFEPVPLAVRAQPAGGEPGTDRPGAAGDLGERPAHVAADEHVAVGDRRREDVVHRRERPLPRARPVRRRHGRKV